MTTFLANNDEGANLLKEKTIQAEVLYTNFMVHHNLSFLTSEQLSLLHSKMFPDSKIARNCKCSQTKTMAILNEAMNPSLKYTLEECMKEQPFTLVNYGTSDCGIKKMNTLCAYIFDVNSLKHVQLKFYDMCATSGEHCSKAVTLFNEIDGTRRWYRLVQTGI